MKWVYMALINGKVSAFHKKESVVKAYLSGYKMTNPKDECYIGKVKRDSVETKQIYRDFYLTEVFDDVYIQQKYEDVYLCFFVTDDQHDLNTMRNDVSRILNSGKCNKKQKRRLVEALVVLDEIEDESKIYDIPPIHVLEENYWQLEEYRNKIYL